MMANANLPQMMAMGTINKTYDAHELFQACQDHRLDNRISGLATLGNLGGQRAAVLNDALKQAEHKKGKEMSRRIVKVLIADPNENIPLEDCLLFSGEEKLTDATDQELFFELDIKSLLEKHNAKRVKLFDKKVKDRMEYLEPAKVRDLKMVVVTVATL